MLATDRPQKRLMLNFSPVFIDRVKKYASGHGMKINAVLKKAFEHLEDHEAALESVAPRKAPRDLGY
jgi:hypothetical protein